jgi:hypothetical protein
MRLLYNRRIHANLKANNQHINIIFFNISIMMHTSFSTLLLPSLLLAPSAFSYPGHKNPEFKLSNILYNSSYTYSTPAHLATKYGKVSFDLANSAVSYTTHCNAYSMREFDFFYGEITYTCDPVPNEVGSTNFTFSTSGAIAVNQTWTCEEEGGPHGSVEITILYQLTARC